jgi:hypothetical protein
LDVYIGFTKDVEIIESMVCDNLLTIVFTEKNGSFYGAKSAIKIPAKTYDMLEQAVVERWLEKKKSTIPE